jgi:hypothetical protein
VVCSAILVVDFELLEVFGEEPFVVTSLFGSFAGFGVMGSFH